MDYVGRCLLRLLLAIGGVSAASIAATMDFERRYSFRLRLLLCAASALCLGMLAATAADRYGKWLLEQPQTSVVTLSFKQSVLLNDKAATSELGFICHQENKLSLVGVILIPFDGTFQNHQSVIPVLIQQNQDRYDRSDLLQHWKNGADYISLESEDDVDELVLFLKAREADGVKSVHFFFPNDPDSSPQISNHIVIDVSGFSNGFVALIKACGLSP
jgi:hypothetical protein